MNQMLRTHFVRRFPNGPRIEFAVELPMNHFRITVLFGPSGCGKTTVLRCLAGLDRPQEGTIHWGDECWFDATHRTWVPPQNRHIGFVTQENTLFPHLNVIDNIAYCLRGSSQDKKSTLTESLVRLVGLAGFEHRYPRQLSQGQRQRVALARALARQPRLMLLDEPFRALDEPTRATLQAELCHWLARARVPTILVTHDRQEALMLADEILVMHDGRVLQRGQPSDVFSHPATVEVARIVGSETVVPATLVGVEKGLVQLRVGNTTLWASGDQTLPSELFASIRADNVALHLGVCPSGSARNQLPARVVHIQPLGNVMRVELDCGFRLAATITWEAFRELHIEPDTSLVAEIKASAIQLIPRLSGANPSDQQDKADHRVRPKWQNST